MNPSVWGPQLWRIIADITYHSDQLDYTDSKKSQKNVISWLESLKYLLPCVHCRESYTKYVNNFPPTKSVYSGCLLSWSWVIHELVNDKLKKADRIPYDMYVRRMNAWTRAASPTEVVDFMWVLGLNYKDKYIVDVTRNITAGMIKFHNAMLTVIPYPTFTKIYTLMFPRKSDFYCQSKYLTWLYKFTRVLYENMGYSLPSIKEWMKRYYNFSAQTKIPSRCKKVRNKYKRNMYM